MCSESAGDLGNVRKCVFLYMCKFRQVQAFCWSPTERLASRDSRAPLTEAAPILFVARSVRAPITSGRSSRQEARAYAARPRAHLSCATLAWACPFSATPKAPGAVFEKALPCPACPARYWRWRPRRRWPRRGCLAVPRWMRASTKAPLTPPRRSPTALWESCPSSTSSSSATPSPAREWWLGARPRGRGPRARARRRSSTRQHLSCSRRLAGTLRSTSNSPRMTVSRAKLRNKWTRCSGACAAGPICSSRGPPEEARYGVPCDAPRAARAPAPSQLARHSDVRCGQGRLGGVHSQPLWG